MKDETIFDPERVHADMAAIFGSAIADNAETNPVGHRSLRGARVVHAAAPASRRGRRWPGRLGLLVVELAGLALTIALVLATLSGRSGDQAPPDRRSPPADIPTGPGRAYVALAPAAPDEVMADATISGMSRRRSPRPHPQSAGQRKHPVTPAQPDRPTGNDTAAAAVPLHGAALARALAEDAAITRRLNAASLAKRPSTTP